MTGIWVVVSPLTWVLDNAANCVASMTAMPLVLIAPTCVELNDWMSVTERPWITVVGSAAICAGVKLDIGITPTRSVSYSRQERRATRSAHSCEQVTIGGADYELSRRRKTLLERAQLWCSESEFKCRTFMAR